MYAIFLVFTLAFIGLVARSVWLDLYGKETSKGLQAEHPTVQACLDELDRLSAKLESRLSMPMTPRAPRDAERFRNDWDSFTREFEDRLHVIESRCIDGVPADNANVRAAMAASAERLDSLRTHLARCGEEGEQEREAARDALASLREAVSQRAP